MKRTRQRPVRYAKKQRQQVYQEYDQPLPRYRAFMGTGESKYFDTEVSAFSVAGTTAWANTNDVIKGLIATPQEGSDINNRVGRKIEVYKIAIRGVIRTPAITDQADAYGDVAVRVILWQDQQCNAAATTSAALMQDSTTSTASLQFCSFQNPNNFGRFRVLKDKIIYPRDAVAINDSAATGSIAMPDVPFKITHKFAKPVVVKFNGTNGGSIADVVNNAFYLSAQKSQAIFDNKVMDVRARCYYKDQ